MFPAQDRSFLTVGAEVVTIASSGWNSRITSRSKIAKILKTQVVLENGKRFTLSRLEEVGQGHYGARLFSATDERVASIEREAVLRGVESKARTAVEEWMKGESNRRSPERIREVIAEMQTLLAEVEKGEG